MNGRGAKVLPPPGSQILFGQELKAELDHRGSRFPEAVSKYDQSYNDHDRQRHRETTKLRNTFVGKTDFPLGPTRAFFGTTFELFSASVALVRLGSPHGRPFRAAGKTLRSGKVRMSGS